MNYKYKLIDKEFILSEEEHKKVTDQVRAGNSMVYLRGGTLMVNMNFVASVNETGDRTEIQEEKYLNQLPAGNFEPQKRSEWLEKMHKSFYEKMGWNK